jgi:tRNA-specific 2-thiouridylase
MVANRPGLLLVKYWFRGLIMALDKTLSEKETVEAICHVASKREVSAVPINKTRVAVLMSGGVDSSAVALLMKEAGYDVVGVTGWLIKSGSRCCDTGMVDAARVCEQLEIEHHAVDLRELFKREIIDEFPKSYARAQTPLPCSVCNTLIKWGALLNYSQRVLNASYIATGHYARILETDQGLRLARAADPHKDQSYVLWGLTMGQLKATLLPLGGYVKDDIRKIAQEGGLVNALRPDSQDLCFIPFGSTTQEYLANFLPSQSGAIVHTLTGAVLGTHQGTFNYTIGQRRGIGISYPEPLYVTSLDTTTNTVYVGSKEALLSRELQASCVNWILETPPVEPFACLAKIRYNSPCAGAMVYPLPDNKVKVVFDEPQPAITAGQVLGIYDLTDTYILGGGWID